MKQCDFFMCKYNVGVCADEHKEIRGKLCGKLDCRAFCYCGNCRNLNVCGLVGSSDNQKSVAVVSSPKFG